MAALTVFGRYSTRVGNERRLTFSIRSEVERTGQVVAVAGDADMTAVPYLEEAIRAAAETAAVVIIDLSETRFVDSSVMRALIGWTKQLHAANGRLPIVCTDPNLIRVFKQTGLDEVLELVGSRAVAAR